MGNCTTPFFIAITQVNPLSGSFHIKTRIIGDARLLIFSATLTADAEGPYCANARLLARVRLSYAELDAFRDAQPCHLYTINKTFHMSALHLNTTAYGNGHNANFEYQPSLGDAHEIANVVPIIDTKPLTPQEIDNTLLDEVYASVVVEGTLEMSALITRSGGVAADIEPVGIIARSNNNVPKIFGAKTQP